MIKSLVILCLALTGISAVAASSEWSCPSDEAAISNLLSSDDGVAIDSGPLSKHGFELYISNQLIDPDKQIILQTGYDYVIRIKVTDDRFRGVFFRLEASDDDADTTDALLPRDGTMEPVDACEAPVVGIGTVEFRPMPGVTATLRMDEETTATLDVTVVKTLTDELITYSYDQYRISFGQDVPPVASPTNSPAVPPVPAPTLSSFCSADKVQQCQSDNLSSQESQSCSTCVDEALSASISSCSQLESVLCRALTTCSCGSCSVALGDYLSCAYERLLGCSVDCSLSTQVAATRTYLDEFTFAS